MTVRCTFDTRDSVHPNRARELCHRFRLSVFHKKILKKTFDLFLGPLSAFVGKFHRDIRYHD